jgi:NTP pyrophosphatase (non-canonical NTP hydrolase)
MDDIQILIDELVKFRDERNWSQFHNTKDLALATSIEAAELNELFLWKTSEESELVDRNKLKEELLTYLLSASYLRVNMALMLRRLFLKKLKKIVRNTRLRSRRKLLRNTMNCKDASL